MSGGKGEMRRDETSLQETLTVVCTALGQLYNPSDRLTDVWGVSGWGDR